MQIKNRTFVISGGASGLGQATAYRLYSDGAYIAILDVNEENGQQMVRDLVKNSDNCGGDKSGAKFFQVDVSDTESVAQAVNATVDWSKSTGLEIGGVIAAAGVGYPAKIIDRAGQPLPLEGFDFVLNINLRGTIDLFRQLLPTMIKNTPLEADGERAVLIMVSSVAAFEGQPGQLSYAASKGALASSTIVLARDLAQHGIRAMTIAPGSFRSAMTDLLSDKVRKSLEQTAEFPKRFGNAHEFASLVAEIVRNPMLNGEVIRLDGGARMSSRM